MIRNEILDVDHTAPKHHELAESTDPLAELREQRVLRVQIVSGGARDRSARAFCDRRPYNSCCGGAAATARSPAAGPRTAAAPSLPSAADGPRGPRGGTAPVTLFKLHRVFKGSMRRCRKYWRGRRGLGGR